MKIFLIGVAVLVLVIGILYNNRHIRVVKYRYTENVPADLEHCRILQVSDIHADLPAAKYRMLLQKSMRVRPDFIVVTGDCIDRLHIGKKDRVAQYLRELAAEFPVYAVSGNHEYMHEECAGFLEELEALGVKVLHNTYAEIRRGDSLIRLYGVDDPYALYGGKIPKKYSTPVEKFKDFLKKMTVSGAGESDMSILLSHRPEFFEDYCKLGMDIVFAGHAHGGQWRLPFIKGIIAPDQGLFPKYVGGCYREGMTTMYVSRGLGNSVVPVRLFNPPELVVVELGQF